MRVHKTDVVLTLNKIYTSHQGKLGGLNLLSLKTPHGLYQNIVTQGFIYNAKVDSVSNIPEYIRYYCMSKLPYIIFAIL